MTRRYGIAANMGIGDFVFSSVFIPMVLAKHPGSTIDVGVKDYMIPVLKKWGIFRKVLDYEALWAHSHDYEVVFSGRHCYPLGSSYENSWLVPNRDRKGQIPLEPVYLSNVKFLVAKGFEGSFGKPFWVLDKKNVSKALELLKGFKRPIIGLHNSKREQFWFRRKWKNSNFESLIRTLRGTCLQLGSLYGDWDGHQLSGAHFLGDKDLQLVSAIISLCDGFVSADTGLAAIAQALSVPTVQLMGPTDVLGVINASVVTKRVCGKQPCLYCRGDKIAEDIMLRCKGRDTFCMDHIKVEDVRSAVSCLLLGGSKNAR